MSNKNNTTTHKPIGVLRYNGLEINCLEACESTFR